MVAQIGLCQRADQCTNAHYRLHDALAFRANVEHTQRIRRQQLLVGLTEEHRHDRESKQRQQRRMVPDVAQP